MESNHSRPQADTEQTNSSVVPTGTDNSGGKAGSKDSSFDFSEQPVMATLSYLGPLVIIPFLTHRDNPFVLFHIKQGLVLFILLLILQFIQFILVFLLPLMIPLYVGLLVLGMVGILNALRRKEVELPIIGKFASHIKL